MNKLIFHVVSSYIFSSDFLKKDIKDMMEGSPIQTMIAVPFTIMLTVLKITVQVESKICDTFQMVLSQISFPISPLEIVRLKVIDKSKNDVNDKTYNQCIIKADICLLA